MLLKGIQAQELEKNEIKMKQHFNFFLIFFSLKLQWIVLGCPWGVRVLSNLEERDLYM